MKGASQWKRPQLQQTLKRAVRDFALALTETPQYKAFERAAERFTMDQAAQKAKQAFEQKQQALNRSGTGTGATGMATWRAA